MNTTANENQSNPQLAQAYTATIFATLYESWPVRVPLTAQQITGIEYDLDLLFNTPRTPIPGEWTVCSELFVWLEKEGYIDTQGARGNIWSLGRTQLTHKAIETLKSVPDPVNPGKKRTMIDAIVDASKEGGKQARNQLVNLAMTALYQALH
jgi:hypothetical protein